MTGTRSKMMKAHWSNIEWRQRMVQVCRRNSQKRKPSAFDKAVRDHRLRKRLAQMVHDDSQRRR